VEKGSRGGRRQRQRRAEIEAEKGGDRGRGGWRQRQRRAEIEAEGGGDRGREGRR
jgi:hypothetical protein